VAAQRPCHTTTPLIFINNNNNSTTRAGLLFQDFLKCLKSIDSYIVNQKESLKVDKSRPAPKGEKGEGKKGRQRDDGEKARTTLNSPCSTYSKKSLIAIQRIRLPFMSWAASLLRFSNGRKRASILDRSYISQRSLFLLAASRACHFSRNREYLCIQSAACSPRYGERRNFAGRIPSNPSRTSKRLCCTLDPLLNAHCGRL
jgi:hypothetical protein